VIGIRPQVATGESGDFDPARIADVPHTGRQSSALGLERASTAFGAPGPVVCLIL